MISMLSLELAAKLYNSVTGFLCLCASMNFHPDEQLFQLAAAWIKLLTLGLQSQRSLYLCTMETHKNLKFKNQIFVLHLESYRTKMT